MDVEPPAAPPGAPPPPQQPVPPQQPAGATAPCGVPPPPLPPPAPPATTAAAQAAALGAGAALVNVTFEHFLALLVAYPSLAPRPTATNIRTLIIKLVAVLSGIPSHQSAANSHTGLVEQRKVYTLTGEIPWYNFGDPNPCDLALMAH